jgi:predicted nucleic acid-binding protein
LEVRNVVLLSERRGRLTRQRADGALAYLRRAPVALDHAPGETRLLDLARAHQLTAYDAAYLELAQRMGVPLASSDRSLAAAARAIGIETVG